jgi:hypothetical protein
VYINAKITPLQTVPGKGENRGGGVFKYDMYDTL